jgi:NAD(P)-dependent dehydrogenase (short-subunit alcohol dehydrogenase family)
MSWTLSDMPSQRGRSAVVTGAGGLGYETALALARSGAEVILAGRSPDKGAQAMTQIRAAAPDANLAFELLDLASLASVEAFAGRIAQSRGSLDLLVNNAGVMALPSRKTTADGFEMQLGTNHLGHFALTGRLLPMLRKAPAPRVVNVSSVAHRNGKIAFDDLQSERRYTPFAAYSQSKMANLLFTLELQRRSEAAGWGVTSNSAHPGYAYTDLIQNGPGADSFLNKFDARFAHRLVGHSAAAGALPLLYAATAPAATGGSYTGPGGFMELQGAPKPAKVAPYARNQQVAGRLWAASEALTGVTFGPG